MTVFFSRSMWTTLSSSRVGDGAIVGHGHEVDDVFGGMTEVLLPLGVNVEDGFVVAWLIDSKQHEAAVESWLYLQHYGRCRFEYQSYFSTICVLSISN